MSRKNGNVRRSNDRGRLARRNAELAPKVKEQPRIRIEDLVLPDGQCKHFTKRPKARFATKHKADKALAQAQQQRARIGSGHVEKRVYQCPKGGCDGWHLTSREAFDESTWQQRRKQYEQKHGGSV